jgi:proteasome inhibitor subunit 1 (PI31)
MTQGLFVGNKFEVYLSDDKNHTHSIELDVDSYVSLSASSSNAADLLRDLAALRTKLTPFLENVAPKKPVVETRSATPGPRSPPLGVESGGSGGGFSPYVIPPVGSGDILPPGLGGGDPSSQVGPDHPMFGRRYDPTRGPVPGARFDPFGPFSADPQGPPRGFIGGPHPMRPGPAPGIPFGDPNPDHLRMPRDDDMADDPFGPRGGRRGGAPGFPQPRGGGGGFGHMPFGSGDAFY